MLIKCPECELQVSDKAISCPHCGFPLQPNIKPRKPRNKNNKRRRLPNGFGQISEIKNRNLRNPFRAMISVGKDSNGRPICKPLKPESYFPTYNEAYAALVEYNKNPYDLEPSITMKELYEKWLAEYEKTVKSTRSVASAWGYCSAVYDMRVKDIRARHVKGCMDEGISKVRGEEKTPSASMKNQIKSLFNLMLDYALEYELVDRNYSRTFNLSEETIKEIVTVKNEHIPFTDEEMDLLWKHADDKMLVDVLLIQCYSGWRPQELGLLELKNVDLKNWTFRGGIKTDAGTDRVVPIHSKIRHDVLSEGKMLCIFWIEGQDHRVNRNLLDKKRSFIIIVVLHGKSNTITIHGNILIVIWISNRNKRRKSIAPSQSNHCARNRITHNLTSNSSIVC